MAQMVKCLPTMRETWVRSLGQEDFPGEGNGNPLQYSCLENPMDGGAWWAIVHGVAKSQTGLTDFTFTLSSGHRSGKVQFSFQSQRMLKLLHNCTHLTH